MIGIGADINMPDNRGNLVDSINGSVILRIPWERTGLAPYIFGGGGRLTDPVWTWAAHAGLGLEWRMNPITAIFADVRYTWPEKSGVSDFTEFRGGFRFIF